MCRRTLVLLLLAASFAVAQQPAKPALEHSQRSLLQLMADAQQAMPPLEQYTKLLRPDLVAVNSIDPSIKTSFAYATSDNFLGKQLYHNPKPYLERPVAEALVKAAQELQKLGYGLLIYDAYRPWWVTKLMWDATPVSMHSYLGDPATGSVHNRACAVDLTLYDLKTGKPEPMPSKYDEMDETASPTYTGGTETARLNRNLLITTMQKYGFTVNPREWWHFDYKDWQKYPVLNIGFNDVPPPQSADPCVCEDPVPISTPDAQYTEEARKRRISGTVSSWMFLGSDGVPRQVIVFKKLGFGLDQKVMSTLMNWRFEPATLDDRPIPQLLSIDSDFHYHPGLGAARKAPPKRERAPVEKKK